MRVVHVSNGYGQVNAGGAAIAATRLHLALLEAGVDSHFITLSQREPGPNVRLLKPCHVLRRRFVKLIYNVIVNLYRLFVRRQVGFCRYQLPGHFMSVYDLQGELKKLSPDVVHIHWINDDGFSWHQISRLSYPVVFHLHDMHLFSTAYGYVWNDRRYVEGYNRGNSSWIDLWNVRAKRKMLVRLHPTMIGPSNWICVECRQSIIGRGLESVAIPNVVNPGGRLRMEGRLSHRQFVLLFGCFAGTKNRYKGWDDLIAALRLVDAEVRQNAVVRVFGEEAANRIEADTRIEFLGQLKTTDELILAYNSADVFVMPSRQDNAPSVKFESWLCGLPVLAFERQGCAEGIVPKTNGWISPDGDVADYAKGIEYFYWLWKNGELESRHSQIAECAARAYATDEILMKYLKVYERLIGKVPSVVL